MSGEKVVRAIHPQEHSISVSVCHPASFRFRKGRLQALGGRLRSGVDQFGTPGSAKGFARRRRVYRLSRQAKRLHSRGRHGSLGLLLITVDVAVEHDLALQLG
jgi:hypothetical protein